MKKNTNNFDDFEYTPIENVQSIESDGEIIKVWVRNLWLDEIWQEKTAKDKYKAKSSALLKDQDGNKIETTEFSKTTYFELREYKRKGLPIEVLAKVVKSEKKDYFLNKLELLSHRIGDLPLRQIQASRNEIKLVQKFLAAIAAEFKKGNRWGLLEEIRNYVIEDLQIVGTEIDDLYSDSIDAIICQAFSAGKIGNTNGKINTCIIGPPAGGKKLLWLIAKQINYVSEEAQAIRVTPAGITASMSKYPELGSIPLANKGVFGIQDFDKCEEKEELLPIFSDVMEDGKVVVTGVYKFEFEAETAIYLDINRLSDLYLDKNTFKNVTVDTSLPTNILSRIDFIAEFKNNPDLQDQKASQVFTNPSDRKKRKSILAEFSIKNGIKTDRFIKLIVAYVMTEMKNVNTESVNKYMIDKFSQISAANKNNLDKIPELAMFQMRLANSFKKFVHSLTRIQLLDESNHDAVDIALNLLSRKLDFLKNINKNFSVPKYRKTGKWPFAKWIVDNYGKNTFAPEDVIKKYKKKGCPCGKVSVRTLRYWITDFAYKEEQNIWKIEDHIVEKFAEGDS